MGLLGAAKGLRRLWHPGKHDPESLVAKLDLQFASLPFAPNPEVVVERIAALLAEVKAIIGIGEVELSEAGVLAIREEARKTKLLVRMAAFLRWLDSETLQDVAQVFGAIVRLSSLEESHGGDYMQRHKETLKVLFDSYDESPEMALCCGHMIRDCLWHPQLARVVLEGPLLARLFDLLQHPRFVICSDALHTLKELLTHNKALVAEYLGQHYDQFRELYVTVITSDNYVVRLQSLKLSMQLLKEPANTDFYVQFTSDVHNLCTVMDLLRDESNNIELEAFHVFQIIVTNPRKPRAVIQVLLANKDKLIPFLAGFLEDRSDEKLEQEKADLIRIVNTLTAASSRET